VGKNGDPEAALDIDDDGLIKAGLSHQIYHFAGKTSTFPVVPRPLLSINGFG
jgi:hypothetical protein